MILGEQYICRVKYDAFVVPDSQYVVRLYPKFFGVEKRCVRSHLVIIDQELRMTSDDLWRWRLIFRRVDTFSALISNILAVCIQLFEVK